MFPLELFVLACQANGLCTGIMEGFDGRHVRDLIGYPKRYFVMGVVPFGYGNEENKKATLRYPPGYRCVEDVTSRENGVRREVQQPEKGCGAAEARFPCLLEETSHKRKWTFSNDVSGVGSMKSAKSS